MSALRNLAFDIEYRSGTNDLSRELYMPALACASEYCRAVGYFSSSVFESLGKPLLEFFRGDGKMRLVTSIELSAQDIRAISDGLDKKSAIERRLILAIKDQFQDIQTGAALLSELVAQERLEIKVALPTSGHGIYHEKIGIFVDHDGNYVAFSGSSNETKSALEHNYECVDVFTSWKEPERAAAKRRHFELLWNNNAIGVETFIFPEAARRELLRTTEPTRAREVLRRNDDVVLWPHQRTAHEIFLSNKKGILEMATGTGKTRTALAILSSLVQREIVDSIIIAADGKDLLSQWFRQVAVLASNLPGEYRVLRHFGSHFEKDEYALDPKESILIVSSSNLHSIISRPQKQQQGRTLIILDEVHSFGSQGNVNGLTGRLSDYSYILGLSATPERAYDVDGNEFLEQQVGPVLFRYTLEQAIRDGILCEFNYIPVYYTLTAEDRQKVHKVQKHKAARLKDGNPMSDEEFARQISEIYKNSMGKLQPFSNFLKTHGSLLDRSIIFVPSKSFGQEIQSVVHLYRHDFHTYYDDDARQYLQDFADEKISTLITCHRISEGIDIQSVNTVILLSSDKSTLETIQRIGRCLRIDRNNPAKRSTIIDMIRVDERTGDIDSTDHARLNWLQKLSQTRRKSINAS